MQVRTQITIESNRGGALIVTKGQRIRIKATTIVDFVAFSRENPADRLDQARTKAINSKLFLTTGDFLISRADRPMYGIRRRSGHRFHGVFFTSVRTAGPCQRELNDSYARRSEKLEPWSTHRASSNSLAKVGHELTPTMVCFYLCAHAAQFFRQIKSRPEYRGPIIILKPSL
jgi:uncharacterized protein YcgI (DUF1989 family)